MSMLLKNLSMVIRVQIEGSLYPMMPTVYGYYIRSITSGFSLKAVEPCSTIQNVFGFVKVINRP